MPERQPPDRLWTLLREALAGSRRDLTAMPLGRAIFILAVPMVLEMVMESAFAVADIFWVSKLGADAVAAVGLAESLLTVVYAIAIGLAMGVGAVVSRRIGEKDPDAAARAAAQAIFIGVVLSVATGLLGAAFGAPLLRVMGASPAVVTVGARYTQVLLGGSVTATLIFLINAAFRGAGDAAISMRTLWLANAINIGLGPLLVFGLGPFPRLGVTGAAVATTIGRGIGVLYLLRALGRGRGRLAVTRAHLRPDRETLRTILRLAKNGVVQTLIGFTSWIGLIRILSPFGSVPLAGYTIAMRVVTFALLPSVGLGNAAATLVGQNLGARDPARAEDAVWRAARYNLLFLGLVGLALVAGAPMVIRLFTADPGVVAEGGRCLRIVGLGFGFYAYAIVVSQAFNGAGDTWTPTLINLGCFWLGEIPLAALLSRTLGLGPEGTYAAVTAAFSVMAVISVALFRRGRWKTIRV
ncbi:MAG TPA: MATE family efflux transporter [Polyangia bacterium]|nr:MATE family efflux transporter [Polyangia bacterium]